MKLGIIIPTYQRKDRTTPTFLTRALNSVLNQTHQDFKVFLIGDAYTDQQEFETLASLLPRNQVYYENLSFAKERDKYPLGSRELWCSGGTNAVNHGIDIAIQQGYNYVCHLDHDDYWEQDHLQCISDVLDNYNNVAFVYTCSEHIQSYLPQVPLDGKIILSNPQPCGLIHSSMCIDHSLIKSRYRDANEELGYPIEADADMWQRVSRELYANKQLKSILIKKLTCHHTQEKH